MGIATVLRKGENGEISHRLFCIKDGVYIYLSLSAGEKMMNFGVEQVNSYYSGADQNEIDSLKEDLVDILMGEVQPEVLKYKIALSIGYIDAVDDVVGISL